MKRKCKVRVAMLLTIFICLEIVLSNSHVCITQMLAKETLPFEFLDTDYGVVNSDVVAKELKVTDENVEIINTAFSDMLLLKQKTDSGKVKIYTVGTKGLIHTFEVETENEWLKHLTDTEGENRDFIPVTEYIGKYYDSKSYWGDEMEICQYEDSIMVVKNPVTGKYDLMNLTTGKYYEYNYDRINDFSNEYYNKFEYDVNYIPYEKDGKCGFLDKHGEKLTEAKFTGCYKKDASILICYMENDQKSIVTKDGKLDGGIAFRDGVIIDNCAYISNWKDNADEIGEVDIEFTDYFIDFKTGKITEYQIEEKHGRGAIVGFNEEDTIVVYDYYSPYEYDFALVKSYFMTPNETVDLNEKLGGEYCDVFKSTEYKPDLTENYTEGEYLYVEAYSVVKNKEGKWDKEYSYRGWIDEKGNKVYGTDLPEDGTVEFCCFAGDYGLVLDTPIMLEKDSGTALYMTLKAVNRNGNVYYQIPAELQIGGYSAPVARYIESVYMTKDYFSFHLKKHHFTTLSMITK